MEVSVAGLDSFGSGVVVVEGGGVVSGELLGTEGTAGSLGVVAFAVGGVIVSGGVMTGGVAAMVWGELLKNNDRMVSSPKVTTINKPIPKIAISIPQGVPPPASAGGPAGPRGIKPGCVPGWLGTMPGACPAGRAGGFCGGAGFLATGGAT